MEHEKHLEFEILHEYLAEYRANPRAFQETLYFPQCIQQKEERRPHNYGMMRGNRFLLSTFNESLTCAAGVWVKKLEDFFLIHLVVDREAVKFAALHLEGEAKTWWFSHWDHARVSTLADFSQRLIRIFGQKREEPSPPAEEAHTNAIIVL